MKKITNCFYIGILTSSNQNDLHIIDSYAYTAQASKISFWLEMVKTIHIYNEHTKVRIISYTLNGKTYGRRLCSNRENYTFQ